MTRASDAADCREGGASVRPDLLTVAGKPTRAASHYPPPKAPDGSEVEPVRLRVPRHDAQRRGELGRADVSTSCRTCRREGVGDVISSNGAVLHYVLAPGEPNPPCVMSRDPVPP